MSVLHLAVLPRHDFEHPVRPNLELCTPDDDLDLARRDRARAQLGRLDSQMQCAPGAYDGDVEADVVGDGDRLAACQVGVGEGNIWSSLVSLVASAVLDCATYLQQGPYRS